MQKNVLLILKKKAIFDEIIYIYFPSKFVVKYTVIWMSKQE